MHKLQLGLLLGGALAPLITGGSGAIAARDMGPMDVAESVIESAPQPAPATTTQPAAKSTLTEAEQALLEGVPLPEPANVPPPGIRDIGDPWTANLAAVDIPIVQSLREIVEGKQIDRVITRKREREAVATFYAARSFVPLWIDNGIANERAIAAIARLKAADLDGLDPDDYVTPKFKADAEPGALAKAEITLTSAVLTYARHAQSGRVHFSRVSSEISYELVVPEPLNVLAAVAGSPDVGATLDGYNPPHAGYRALKAELVELLRGGGRTGAGHIAKGIVLKIGMRDERVAGVRERLGISTGADSHAYDSTLAAAVKKFQRQHHLPASGELNSATIDALNAPRRGRDIDVIVANMERWRWMPRELGDAYSILNIPDFSLKVVRNGATDWRTKVVVGKLSTPTPIFSDSMKFITVNPTWNVPPSIINGEYLPALQEDPTALDRLGIKVIRNSDGTVRMYQPPGDGNALGRLRFNFPNKYLVYQHDTPDKYLFDKTVRAYSNGCMRVQDPFKYAEVLLSIALPNNGYMQERLRKMQGGPERNINFAAHVPVHLTYQTAFVDDSGKLVLRDDIYGYDRRIQELLRGESRRVADIAVPSVHRHGGESATHRLSSRGHDTGSTLNTPSFFERLFR